MTDVKKSIVYICVKCENRYAVKQDACGKCGQKLEPWSIRDPVASIVGNAVDHPSHYNVGGIEVIDAIEAWKLDFHLGSAVKYIARAGHKDPAKMREDIEKAIWYLQRYIDVVATNPKPGDES